jgi:hypothetical protein
MKPAAGKYSGRLLFTAKAAIRYSRLTRFKHQAGCLFFIKERCRRHYNLTTEAYKLLSINAVNCDLDNAPTFVASTSPFLNIISVGIPRIPYLGGVAVFSSIFSLATFSLPAYSPTISSRIGAIILHGPHHSAQ